MTENRRMKRWHVIYYLRIFDQDTGSLLGHLVDITTEGIKMVSEDPIPAGKGFRLRMEVPVEGRKAEGVFFNARSLWSSKDTNPDFYATGFHLENPDNETINVIQFLIDDLSFDD